MFSGPPLLKMPPPPSSAAVAASRVTSDQHAPSTFMVPAPFHNPPPSLSCNVVGDFATHDRSVTCSGDMKATAVSRCSRSIRSNTCVVRDQEHVGQIRCGASSRLDTSAGAIGYVGFDGCIGDIDNAAVVKDASARA